MYVVASIRSPLVLDSLTVWQAGLLYVALALPTIFLWRRARLGQSPARGAVTLGVRLAVLAVLVLILAGARWSRRLDDLEVVVLRDASASADQAAPLPQPTLDASVDAYLSATTSPDVKPRGDRLGVVRFARDATIESMPAATPYHPGSGPIADPAARQDTDVAAGIRLALSAMTGDAMHRLVLLWDGRATRGDLDAALAQAAARRVPIDVIPLEYAAGHEVIVERVDAPSTRREGEAFSLRVVVRSTNPGPVAARLGLRDRGRPLDMDLAAPGLQATRSVTLAPGLNVIPIEVAAGAPGVRDFEAVLEADRDADARPANNSARAFTFVTGRGRVLYVDNVADGGGRPLADALSGGAAGLAVDHVGPRDFPATLAELQGYDAVVLANVPRGGGGLDESQQRALARYVHDLGGGLLMIGGPDGFGAGGWIGSDLEKVLPVDCSIPSTRVLPAGLLVIVLDRSGSMNERAAGAADRTKQEIANESAVLAVKALAKQDLVGVVAFDSNADWVVPVAPNARPEETARAIRQIGQGGGTAIPAGLARACEAVEAVTPDRAAVKHVLLLTDGQSTGGDYDGLVARLTRAGATLSTVGVGADVNPQLLASLAAAGKGRFYPVADPSTLPQVFIKEARSIRRTLIQERPFVPTQHGSDSTLLGALGAAVPPLRGMVLTTAKADPNVSVPLVSPDGDPVLAHWRAGLGHVVAFTSDAAPVWGAAWVASDAYARFWLDAVRWASRPPVNTDFQVITSRSTTDPGRARVVVLADDKDGAPKNFLSISGPVAGPDLGGRDLRLAQTGPGRYEGEFDVGAAGNYVGLLQYRSPSGETGTLPAGFTLEGSAELRATSSDNAAILRVVNATGGRVLRPWDAAAARLFAREGLGDDVVSRPAWDVLLAALVALFLVDVAVRRLAWGREDLSRAAIAAGAFVRSFTTVRRGDPTASLGALRSVRARVAEEHQPRREAPVEPTPAATTKRANAAHPVKSKPSPAVPQSPPPPPDESGMSGLMAAKRRARQRFDDTTGSGD